MTSATGCSSTFQARIVRHEFQSNVNANSYRRGWNYIIWFVILVKAASPSFTSAVTVPFKRLCGSYRRSWNIMWFFMYHYKFPKLLYRRSRIPANNSPHQEILSILLQNTSRDMLICTCLLNFHDNRAAFFIPSCS